MIPLVLAAILIPFLGTGLGSGAVFFLKEGVSPSLSRSLAGFAAGVMTAASVWSLLIPAIELSEGSVLPGGLGFPLGMGVFLGLDRLTALRSLGGESSMLPLAVTLHNLPEGMAVGAVCAGWLAGAEGLSPADLLTLSLGIALQNIPEGAIISLPLRAGGMRRSRAALLGTASGAVEPVGAGLTILLSGILIPALPWLLSAAAGAMLYVVLEELVPELRGEQDSAPGLILFALGFVLMMGLDVMLG